MTRRAQLTREAARLFAVKGYHGTSIGDLADEGNLVERPGARSGVIEIEQGDDAPLLGHRHVDERLCVDGLECVGRGPGARV